MKICLMPTFWIFTKIYGRELVNYITFDIVRLLELHNYIHFVTYQENELLMHQILTEWQCLQAQALLEALDIQ